MKLSQRLNRIASAIPADHVVADVGCDHGKLAVHLLLRGNPRVYAIDVSRDSLEKAIRLASESGVGDSMHPCLRDGMRDWTEEIPDTVVIAGLSGHTIAEILESGHHALCQCRQVILQPMQSAASLRIWLPAHGWTVREEAVVWEDGRFFFILFAFYSGEISQYDGDPEMSSYLMEKRDLTYYNWLKSRRDGDMSTRERILRHKKPGYEKTLEVIDARRRREGLALTAYEEGENR